MDILIYNPLSRNGNDPKFIDKIKKSLVKDGHQVKLVNVIDIEDVESFIKTLDDHDRMILVGGDGTLNRIVNRIYALDYKQDVYMYQAGTGNDFIRSLKSKKKLVYIKPYLKGLPTISYQNHKKYFLSGAGLGLDGFVIRLVDQSKHKKNKLNYFRCALEGFKKFKPISATITIDGKTIHEDKLWFVTALHAPYQGGGMKMAPHAKRDEKYLDLLVIKNISKFLLFLIFPTIYVGLHIKFKKFVTIYKAKKVNIKLDASTYMQIDGESKYPIDEVCIEAAI